MAQPQPGTRRDPDSARLRLTRRIPADPTSTALLLAGPAASELWPGVRLVGEAGGRSLVEIDLGDPPLTAATVRAASPARTPTAYVSRFAWSGPALPTTTVTLTLTYAPAGSSALATLATLELDSTGLAGSRVDERTLRANAEGFLDALAQAAERRAYAA